MPIETVEYPVIQKIKDTDDLFTRIEMLEPDARTAFLLAVSGLIAVLESDDGCAVTFADPTGDGHLSVLALGNQALVTPILGAAAELYETVEQSQEGPLQ